MRMLFAVTAWLLSAGVADAYRTNNVAGWDIAVWSQEAGGRGGCVMGANFQDGTRFSIVMKTDYEWALGVANPGWNLKKGASTDVAVYVDRQFVASGKASHINTTTALMPLVGVATFRALQTGQRVDLQTPRGQLSFVLTGSGKALYAVLDCVRALTKPKEQPAVDERLLSQAAATILLENLLQEAGITGHSIETREGNDAVRFTLPDGTEGVFRVSRATGPTSADDYATHVISTGSKVCNGEYLSGKETVPSTDGSIVRKVITTCRVGSTPIRASETTIIRKSDGFLIQLSQIVTGAALTTDGPGKDRDRAALVNAALRLRNAP